MPKKHEVYLTVREADEADFDKPLVRIHKTDKPQDIKWGDYIDISLDKKNWVACKLEAAGDIGIGKIYISIHLRGLLNRDSVGNQISKIGVPCNFHIRKVAYWRATLHKIGN
ncbi:hypothetical protein ACFLX8_03995 [Chloroflexota bacterium]